MTQKEFYDLVEQMRCAQRDYFLTRQRSSLVKAKELEYQVDSEIARAMANDDEPVYWEHFDND